MKRIAAVLLIVILSLCVTGCKGKPEYIRFHEETFKMADLSEETIKWLEWYNELTEQEQLAISYIPGEIHNTLYGDVREGTEEAAETDN